MLSYWLNDEFGAKIPGEFPVKTSDLKNPEIPILSDYSEGADKSFWDKFPKRELPNKATTKVNIDKLKQRVEKAKPSMSATELKRANKVISDLTFGAFPDKVKRKNVVFKIDNMAVLFGWYNGFVKNDKTASEVLKSVHYLSGLTGTTVNVEHVDRMSSEMAALTDELSRRKFSKNEKAARALEESEKGMVNGYILEWLKNPVWRELFEQKAPE